jgi:hypothetical protein
LKPATARLRLVYPLALFALAGGLWVLYSFDPLAASFYPPCPFHLLTDLYCPGCGSTRAFHRLLHGNVSGAMAMNPLMVISLPVIAAALLRPAWTYRPWVPWATLVVLVGFAVLRNLPVFPFALLAPG